MQLLVDVLHVYLMVTPGQRGVLALHGDPGCCCSHAAADLAIERLQTPQHVQCLHLVAQLLLDLVVLGLHLIVPATLNRLLSEASVCLLLLLFATLEHRSPLDLTGALRSVISHVYHC